MKVGNYEVKNVTRETAEVGCQKVTKTEVEAVLKAMNDVPVIPERNFEITKLPNSYPEFLNFVIRNSSTGWVGAAEKQEATGASYGNQAAFFCLERERAEKLLRFLAGELGISVSKNEGLYIVEMSYDNSPWSRSGNKNVKETYSFEEATKRAAAEELSMNGTNGRSYRYRAVPKRD